MKFLRKKILLILLFYSTLFSSIDEQIELIQNASDKDRFEMMNSFKKELIKLQEEERIGAIKKLILITESNNSQEVMEELKDNSKENILEESMDDEIKDDIEENIEFEEDDDDDEEEDD